MAPRYLTMTEAAQWLRFDVSAPKHPDLACARWLARQAIPVVRRGRRVLVDRRVLERWMASTV